MAFKPHVFASAETDWLVYIIWSNVNTLNLVLQDNFTVAQLVLHLLYQKHLNLGSYLPQSSQGWRQCRQGSISRESSLKSNSTLVPEYFITIASLAIYLLLGGFSRFGRTCFRQSCEKDSFFSHYLLRPRLSLETTYRPGLRPFWFTTPMFEWNKTIIHSRETRTAWENLITHSTLPHSITPRLADDNNTFRHREGSKQHMRATFWILRFLFCCIILHHDVFRQISTAAASAYNSQFGAWRKPAGQYAVGQLFFYCNTRELGAVNTKPTV